VNLLPYLTGKNKDDPHKVLYWRQSHKTALRKGDLKLVRQNPRKWELYDLSKDFSETKDLAESQPETLQKFLKEWESINDQMVEPLFK
jgi:arylsulfatase A-like enzyme